MKNKIIYSALFFFILFIFIAIHSLILSWPDMNLIKGFEKYPWMRIIYVIITAIATEHLGRIITTKIDPDEND